MLTRIRIGIDPSTTKTGWAIMFDDDVIPTMEFNGKKLALCGAVEMMHNKKNHPTYGNKFASASDNIAKLKSYFFKIFRELNDAENVSNDAQIILVIENPQIPRYNNISTTTKLALMTGAIANAIIDIIYNTTKFKRENITIKFIEPNEWQVRMFAGENTQRKANLIERDERKEKSLELGNGILQRSGINATTEHDITDAIMLAFYAESVVDKVVIKKNNKNREKKVKHLIPNALALAWKNLAHYDLMEKNGKKLDSKQKKAQAKWREKIQYLEEEKKKLQKPKKERESK